MSTEPRIIPVGDELPAMELPAAGRRTAGTSSADTKAKAKRSTGGRVRARFALLNCVIDRALPGMSRTQLAAWLILYRHAKPDGMVSASVADLARRIGASPRMVRYALSKLRQAGLVKRLKRGTLAGGPSVYRLVQPVP